MLRITVKEKPTFKKKRDNYARRLKTQKLIKYLQSELRSSTTHGLPYIANTEIHWFERIFWAACFGFSCAIIVIVLSAQYTRLVEQPIVNSVEKDYLNWNVSYPAIALCPVTKIDGEMFAYYVNDTLNRTGYNLESYYSAIISVSLEALSVLDLPPPEMLKLINPEDYATTAAELFKRFNNQTLTTLTKWPITVDTTMTEMGICHIINSNVAIFDDPTRKSQTVSVIGPFSFSILLWRILCRQLMLESAILQQVIHPLIGVLGPVVSVYLYFLATLIFRKVLSKWSDSSVAYAKNNIELSVHDIDFFVQLVDYANSYKVYTLSPDEVILSGTPALTFETEGFLSFGVQITSTRASEGLKYIPLHLRKCRFCNETTSKRYPIYSYNRCLLDCRIRMIFKLCGCIPHIYKPLDHEKICNLAELECVLKYKRQILKMSIDNETIGKFDKTDDLPRSFRDCGCLGNCEEDVFKNDRETFLPQVNMNRLRVSISAFPKVRVKREIIFTFYDFFLRSGGVANLCIGTSVISIMELMLTALRIPIYEIMHIAKGVWRRYKRSKLPRFSNNKKQM